MTHNTLFLQRLRIVADSGEVAYDERYHRGVNIIRGHNSSGKSTIVRFIFFVLGGYYTDFVPEAMRCSHVMAEVSINGAMITIKRFLERRDDGKVNGYAPMYIYYGPMAEAVEPGNRSGWKKYPYATTDKSTSFSNVLFGMLGYPPVRAESNITMHQVLRLIYLDQESPVNSLFFYEQFDKEIYRESVANLLLGLYDQQYSDAKSELRDTGKAITEAKVSIRNVADFLQDPRCKSADFIRGRIDRLNDGIGNITKQIQQLRGETQVSQAGDQRLQLEHQRIQADIARQRRECDSLVDEIKQLETEIRDSSYFIETLNKRKDAISHSISTRDYFDSLHLDFCPECLTPIDRHVEEGHCPLCKSAVDKTRGRSQAMRIRIELDYQIRESASLKAENERLLSEKKSCLRRMRRQLTASQKHYDLAVGNVRSTFEERIDRLLQDKGFKEGEILQYQTLLEQAEKYESLLSELDRLKAREQELERYIAAAESRIRHDREAIDRAVSESGVYLLRHDLGNQLDFMQAHEFVIDYSQNMAYISGANNKLSASSAFYLKMVARFALLFASLRVDSMMYPRLLFSDNMEDKGLTEDRAVNFQRTVVDLLEKESPDRFQLIFATSMIAPELDKPEYTIGEYYTPENKSLKISSPA